MLLGNISLQANTKIIKVESNNCKIDYIQLVERKKLIGFKVQNIYYLTDKQNFQHTINNENYISEWKIYVEMNNEYLTCFNKVADVITQAAWFDREEEVTIIIYPDKDNIFHYIRLTFRRSDL